jgi:hypothetical protein
MDESRTHHADLGEKQEQNPAKKSMAPTTLKSFGSTLLGLATVWDFMQQAKIM